jgi:hypothetical protein
VRLVQPLCVICLVSGEVGCAPEGSVTISEGDFCVQSGGTSRPALGISDRSAVGGGY